MKIEGDVCAIEGCNALRQIIYPREGRTPWRSSLCHEHRKQRYREAARKGEADVPTPYLPTPPRAESSAAYVYKAWAQGQFLGVVSYDGRRVYGMKAMESCYRMLVDGMEHVLVSERAMLTIGGKA